MTSSNWHAIHQYDTELSADCVEWCPFDGFHDIFICGTYYLLSQDEKESKIIDHQQERIGSILLIKVTPNKLDILQTIKGYGVLDAKWCDRLVDCDILLATVNAIGKLCVYRLNEERLHDVTSFDFKSEEGDYLTLSLNWSLNRFDEKCLICVTDNKGNAIVLSYANRCLTLNWKWKAHDLEAWTINFDREESKILYTGGDDAKLCIWDQRISTDTPTKKLRHQDSGVTIIQTDTKKDHTIISGSFDEVLLFWDNRQWKRPVCDVKSSGGLWRVKCKDDLILTANIYGGFQIIDYRTEPVVIGDLKDHSSLAYGADWSHLNADKVKGLWENGCESSVMLATCSFYDHKLIVSMFDVVDR